MLHNLPISNALKFVLEFDDATKTCERHLRGHDDNKKKAWEPLIQDGGYLTKYYRTHDEDLSGQVIRNWKNDPSQHGSRHGSIATDVKKWPDIPPVFAKLGEEIQNLYPESFQSEYFLGQIHISKMESRPPKDLPSNNKTHRTIHIRATNLGHMLTMHEKGMQLSRCCSQNQFYFV